MLTRQTIDCAIAALKIIRSDLDNSSRHFAVETQRQHQAEIGAALTELETLREGLAAAPQPDWSQAPEWAQWWAVDAIGTAYWYQMAPFREDAEWYTADEKGEWMHLGFEAAGIVVIPLGIDWRLLKAQRPDAARQPGGEA